MDVYCILDQKFEELDKNKDGNLSPQEIADCLEKCGFQRDRAEAFMKVYDKNKDGKISKEEFIKTSRKKIKDKDINCANLRNLFHLIDKDRSGKISSAEMRKFLKQQNNFVFPMAVEDWIDEQDKDGDKELNTEEFLTFVEKFMGHE